MNTFLDVLIRVGSDPMAWAVLGLMAMVGGISLWRYMRCPLTKAKVPLSAEEARKRLDRKTSYPASYFLIMVAGIGLAVMGLFGLAKTDKEGTVGFLLLAVGLYVILTLPVRLQIKDAELRVVAADEGEPRSIMALELRKTHRRLMSYEMSLVVLFFAVLVLF